jgi:uroporphyrin-III C-methyltransferase
VTPHDIALGRVRLVGAGPGAADLLTLRAARAIGEAQAILCDALVCDDVLALAPTPCTRIRTGKRGGQPSMSQETINQLMLRLARRGLRVVRLKGGDPSIFGRCGEERAFLEAHGVEVEVIPGVTAASAAAAQFGFPLTHRGEARRLILATARIENGALVAQGWPACVDAQSTLVFYMARDSARAVAERLIAEGRSPSTPAAAVENAGRPGARLLRARLDGVAAAVERARPSGPMLLIVGEAAAMARGEGAESARDDALRALAV